MNTKLWTVWSHYFATGEGVTMMAIIGYADNVEQAKALFTDKFGEYFTIGCDAQEGIVRNGVTEFLFSKVLLDRLEANENVSGALLAYGEYHVNKS